MRVVLLVVLASCVSSPMMQMAADRLGTRGRHLHLVDHSQIDDSEVYTFCRDEHRVPIGMPLPISERTYDGACVTFVCPAGDDGTGCR
jgi:hypothetical protein